MSKRTKLILDNALRLMGDDQSHNREPKRLKFNDCNAITCGPEQQPQICKATFTGADALGVNIPNIEIRKTNDLKTAVQNHGNLSVTKSSSNIIIKEILVFKSPLKEIQVPMPCSPGVHTENMQNERKSEIGEIQYHNVIEENLNLFKTNDLEVIVEEVPISKELNERIIIANSSLTENKITDNLEIPYQNNEDFLEEIGLPEDTNMAIDVNIINNNYKYDIIEQEDSDDSIKDRDFIPEAESGSSSEEGDDNLLFDEEEIEKQQKLKQEKEAWKGRSKKGRHNKYPGQTFATRKKLKDSNKTHYTVNGKLKEAKQFSDYKCSCLKNCSEKLSADEREMYFQKFYDLASYDLQTSYIGATLREMPIKRKRAKNGPGKSYTRVYTLGEVEVCRDTYINTYQISTKRVNTALEKKRSSQIKDERGKSGGKKKIDEGSINEIINHIKKFPTYISHYSRSETEAKFLPYDLTESKMYELYIADNHPKVSFQFYKNIFYKHFNLKRKPPVKDTCNKCDMFSSQVKNAQDEEQRLVLKKHHDQHLTNAQLARDQLNKDLKEAITNPLIETICYDMEKVLGLPKLPTNIVYYKRQLSIFNEGIHSGSTNTPYCFLWKEGIAGRGAQEVGSCIKKFIDVHFKKGVEELILWSDSCGGQNRNIKIVIMLKTVLVQHPTLNKVSFKYLESGHSFLPNDTDFGQIERALKNQVRIYTLKDFMSVIGSCKKHNKFVINLMESNDFYSTEDIEKQISNRKVTINKEKVSWLKTKIIKIEKSKPNSIFLCDSHSPDENNFKEIDISKLTRGKKNPIDFQKLKVLYPEGKAISKKKWDDIKTLLKFLPKDAIDFYRIKNIENFEDDIEGFGSKTDFDFEDVF